MAPGLSPSARYTVEPLGLKAMPVASGNAESSDSGEVGGERHAHHVSITLSVQIESPVNFSAATTENMDNESIASWVQLAANACRGLRLR